SKSGNSTIPFRAHQSQASRRVLSAIRQADLKCDPRSGRTIQATRRRGTRRTTFEHQTKWMESAAFVDPYAIFRSRTGCSPVEEAEKKPGYSDFTRSMCAP